MYGPSVQIREGSQVAVCEVLVTHAKSLRPLSAKRPDESDVQGGDAHPCQEGSGVEHNGKDPR